MSTFVSLAMVFLPSFGQSPSISHTSTTLFPDKDNIFQYTYIYNSVLSLIFFDCRVDDLRHANDCLFFQRMSNKLQGSRSVLEGLRFIWENVTTY